jgi:alanyl-tRNA synthetase
MELEFGRDSKILKKIQEAVKAVNEHCSIFIASMDSEGDKIGVNALVSKHHESSGLDARKWCDFCTQALGTGKGGGKADSATASLQASEAVTVDAVLRVASEFWTSANIGN